MVTEHQFILETRKEISLKRGTTRTTIVSGIRKILGVNEKRKLCRGYERAKKILTNAGAKDIFKTGYLTAHPGGTAKVGQLIDSNLKTEYENLYVCDCSIIPEAWGLPPTSTIIVFGKRLAKFFWVENTSPMFNSVKLPQMKLLFF